MGLTSISAAELNLKIKMFLKRRSMTNTEGLMTEAENWDEFDRLLVYSSIILMEE